MSRTYTYRCPSCDERVSKSYYLCPICGEVLPNLDLDDPEEVDEDGSA